MSSQKVAREQKERPARSPLAALEFSRRNFDDPALEWRRLLSVILGTFLLVLVGAGLGVVSAVSNGAISRTAEVTAPGLMVLAIILIKGAISGDRLNPAVSIVFAARGNFSWRRVPGYIIAQLLGSKLAFLLLWGIFGKVGMLCATEPGPGISEWLAIMIAFAESSNCNSTMCSLDQALHTSFRSPSMLKHSCTGYEDVRACFICGLNRVQFDTTIHFQIATRIAGVQHLPHLPNFFQRVWDELLPTKPGIDGHHQHQVQVFDYVLQHVHRGGGTDRNTSLLA
jgi:hypothetical protein